MLPAFLGPGPFFILPIFIIGLLLHASSWKILIFQLIPIILIMLLFTGANVMRLAAPLIVIFLICLGLNKFFDFTEQIKNNFSFINIMMGALLLLIFVLFYSFLFIFMDNSYNIITGWNKWRMFFAVSWLNIFSWSLVISILLKYVFKKK